jgi:hypothetical protein
MTDTFSQTGGELRRLDCIQRHLPFATLLVTDTELRPKFFFKITLSPKSSIFKLSKHRHVFYGPAD